MYIIMSIQIYQKVEQYQKKKANDKAKTIEKL